MDANVTTENLEADVLALRQQLADTDREMARLNGLARRGLENLECERAVSRASADQTKGLILELANAKRVNAIQEKIILGLRKALTAAKKRTTKPRDARPVTASRSPCDSGAELEVALL